MTDDKWKEVTESIQRLGETINKHFPGTWTEDDTQELLGKIVEGDKEAGGV